MNKVGISGTIEDFAQERRRKLFERVSIFGALMSLFHFTQDLLGGAKEAPLIDISITLVLFFCYWLHRRGHYNTARIIGVSFLNLCFTVYACIVPAGIGIYLFYFPLMAISMGIFGKSEIVMRFFFVLLSGVLLISLFLTDFNLIGSYEIDAPNPETFFMINLVSSTFILIMCIHFILNVNEESERRLHILAEEVRIKNTHLEKTNAELDRFFYSTSHDLRSPLLSLKGLVNIAQNDTKDVNTLKYLSMMTDRVDKLDLFVKDIIDYSKNTRTDVVNELVDIDKLVDEVNESFQFLEGASKIEFQKEILDREVCTDRSRVTVILNNLISNAIKYHCVEQTQPWIRIRINIIESMLHIVVSDNGSGIAAQIKAKIFDMFYRGTEQSKGSGLGLYIVKETVEKMNSTIRVESGEGTGCSFIVALPVSARNIA